MRVQTYLSANSCPPSTSSIKGKKVVLAVNKCENANKADLMASEFWELGMEPMPVSAISGTGTGEMLDALMRSLPPPRSLEKVWESMLGIVLRVKNGQDHGRR